MVCLSRVGPMCTVIGPIVAYVIELSLTACLKFFECLHFLDKKNKLLLTVPNSPKLRGRNKIPHRLQNENTFTRLCRLSVCLSVC
jgi:hypothetical protein